MRKEITVSSSEREQLVDITRDVNEVLRASPSSEGVCLVFALHTTAGLTVNEGADPAVRGDILKALKKAVPHDAGYGHSEGNSDSHVKCSLFGVSLPLMFSRRSLVLGQWQSVYLCEFDGPRERKVVIHVLPE